MKPGFLGQDGLSVMLKAPQLPSKAEARLRAAGWEPRTGMVGAGRPRGNHSPAWAVEAAGAVGGPSTGGPGRALLPPPWNCALWPRPRFSSSKQGPDWVRRCPDRHKKCKLLLSSRQRGGGGDGVWHQLQGRQTGWGTLRFFRGLWCPEPGEDRKEASGPRN